MRHAPDNEERIVWLEDVTPLDYVREDVVARSRRRGRPRLSHPGRLVGYSELRPDAPGLDSRQFRRRIFWSKDHDRDTRPDGCYATGAPVAPGVAGELTTGAWVLPRDWQTGDPHPVPRGALSVTAGGALGRR